MKKSAGILVYKKENDQIKVLLCHPGGPYWQGTDLHSWGIPKGEVEEKEKVLATAVREFKEETNLDIDINKLQFLYAKKLSNHKLVIIFTCCEEFNLSNCKSNTFSLEWPKDSGIINEYAENDKYEWFDIHMAKDYIFPKQVVFLNMLKDKITR